MDNRRTNDITDLVKLDLESRAEVGERKYGARLNATQPCNNGISALQNAYEEALDMACYLKKALMEERALPVLQICRIPGFCIHADVVKLAQDNLRHCDRDAVHVAADLEAAITGPCVVPASTGTGED
jgi:hypothetical protein